ncbi:MAG: DNA-3-methyladenine glycosylase I [Nitrosopumilus sp.]
MSKSGFTLVGPPICYALMQVLTMVYNHTS